MSQFTIKTKDTDRSTRRDARLIILPICVIAVIALSIPLFVSGPDAGVPCDPTVDSCGYGSYCINKVCRPSCDEDQDCPEGIKCVTSEKHRLFTREPIKVCRFPNELERSISRSFDKTRRELDERFRMIRKRTDVFTWVLTQLMRKRAQVSNEQFHQYWGELTLEDRRRLTIERLGQMIIRRHTSP